MKKALYMRVGITSKKNKGITLIELLVGLTIAGLVIGASYRTFVSQQKVYEVQDQVVDMQQNLRGAVNRMVQEIRMAGFGNISMMLPSSGAGGSGITVNGTTYSNVVNPNTPVNGSITFLYGCQVPSAIAVAAQCGQNQIQVSSLTDSWGNTLFDTNNRKYISIGGIESHQIYAVDNPSKTISFTPNDTVLYNYPVGTPVFCIRAITYQIGVVNGTPTLGRDDNTGAGSQPVSDSIESLQFAYFDANGNLIANPKTDAAKIRMVNITIVAKADKPDPDFKEGDHYRRRQVASNIHLMNMDLGF